MRTLKLMLLLAALAIAGNVGYGQDTAKYSPPNIYIGSNINSGKHTKESLLVNPFISIQSKDSTKWNIVSYRVVFVRQIGGSGVEDAPITVIGANFSEEVIAKIQSAKSGTIIEFSDIKIQSIVGIRIFFNPIMIRIQ